MFPVTCSTCSKETYVPFKPTPGRPVYCSDCLDKIQSGELKPISQTALRKEEERLEHSKEALADLGIEFASEVRQQRKERTYAAPTQKSHPSAQKPHSK